MMKFKRELMKRKADINFTKQNIFHEVVNIRNKMYMKAYGP